MRIGIYTDTYLPDLNGNAQSAHILATNLRKLGHEVTVVCSGDELLTQKEEGIIRVSGIQIKKLYGYKMSTPIHPLIIEEAKSLGLDIIHAETEFGIGLLANITAHILHIPLVRTYHTDYADYTHYYISEDLGLLYKGAYDFVNNIVKLYGDDCLRLMTPSDKTKDVLIKAGVKTKIDVVPNGIELERFDVNKTSKERVKELRNSFGVKEDEKLLIYLGRVADEKNIDLVVKTFLRVKKENLKIKLVIVGKGPALEKVKKQVVDLNLNDYITITGGVDSSLVPEYYASSDGFISASTSETQGLTYIEALASSLPIIVAYDKVLEGLVQIGKNGFFFENEDECFDAICEFNNLDENDLVKIKKYAKDSSDIYDARKFAEKTVQIYQEVIDEYKDSYHILKTVMSDDIVKLYIQNSLQDERKLYISIDDYVALGIRKDSIVSKEVIDRLSQKEIEVLAYRSALRRLAIKDYSIKQMRDSLYRKYQIDINKLNEIVNKLISLDLLNDEKFTISRIQSLNNIGLSSKAIFYKLKADGVSDDIINKYLNTDANEEIIKARKKAIKYKNTIRGKSINAKKQMILSKLISDGFKVEDAKTVLAELDFSDEKIIENDLLKIAAQKAFLKYRLKYEGYELRNKVFNYLAAKGYTQEAIYTVIVEMGL